MPRKISKKLAFGLLLALCTTGLSAQTEKHDLVLKPSSELQIIGRSNAGAFLFRTSELKLNRVADSLGAYFEVSFAVRSLKSGIYLQERDLYASLKADEAPLIRCVLPGLEFQSDAMKQWQVEIDSRIEIANRTRTVPLVLKGVRKGDELRVTGQQKVKMSDFGITPPVALGGLIRTEDTIQIVFDLKLEEKK